MRIPEIIVRAGLQSQRRRPFSRSFSNSPWPTFGIAFDIDGVILRGSDPIGGSVAALRSLYDDSFSNVKVPFIFLTNGGGVPESKRALELSKLLGVNILSSQVLHGHTPFKQLLKKFENEFIVSIGKGEPATVMSEYGFKKVISIDEYATCFDSIDPIASYKKWTIEQGTNESSISQGNVCSQRVQAAFVVSDPVDWSRDIQVLCDILRTGGLPGKEIAHQPPLFFANDDLEYQGVFPTERLGMGAFRIALESIFNSIHPNPLEYTSFGKPNPSVFKNAEIALREFLSSCHDQTMNRVMKQNHAFRTLYMVGDNPSVDIKGARQAGLPWVSILTRTGVFKGEGNHTEHPADMVFDTVEEAVDYVLVKEGMKN